MKKSVLLLVFIATFVAFANGQDFKLGVRFKPLNSQYQTDESFSINSSSTSTDKYKYRFDSLTMGIFFEKYFPQKSFLIRADINYADLTNSDIEKTSDDQGTYHNAEDYSQVFKQKYINISLGLGTHVNWSKFTFTFGAYVPFTILPKGSQTRDINYYTNYVLTQSTTGKGTIKASMGIGIGAFAGVNIIIFKHLSIGMDVNYDIQYVSRKTSWHGQTQYFSGSPSLSSTDETLTTRNYYTSKLIPSIAISYAFDAKKKTPQDKLLNK
jgi:hypothetical protein